MPYAAASTLYINPTFPETGQLPAAFGLICKWFDLNLVLAHGLNRQPS